LHENGICPPHTIADETGSHWRQWHACCQRALALPRESFNFDVHLLKELCCVSCMKAARVLHQRLPLAVAAAAAAARLRAVAQVRLVMVSEAQPSHVVRQ
jgi:hypothetical protein